MVQLPSTPWSQRDDVLRLALPSDGELYEATLGFFRACGLPVERPSARRYTAFIPTLEGVTVLFQRAADIPTKVEEGSAELGVAGLDRFTEHCSEDGDALLIIQDLGFSRCELAVAVPDSWVDITSMADLADLAVEFRETGRELRIATKYPRLVERFLYRHGMNYFTLVQASGTLEGAPAMGYADIIADIVSSGTTLRENRLKTLEDSSILSSQACLIGNRSFLGRYPDRLEKARGILEQIEAFLHAGDHYRITVNIRGDSPDAVAEQVLERPELAGLHGPTISQVSSPDSVRWFSVTVVLDREHLMAAVDHFRSIGGATISVASTSYLFYGECQAHKRLLEALGKG